MFSFAVDILNFDSKYFLSMINELGTSKLFEKGSFICNNLTIYITVKQIIYEMVYEEVTESFGYDISSDAYNFGFICCFCQQSTGLSYDEIEQILNNL